MKKALSLLLTVIMIASTVIVAIPATMAAETNTLSAHNVGVKIPYHSGETTVNPWQGSGSNMSHVYDDDDPYNINFTEKSSDSKVLNLDGVITEEEWGTPLLDLSSDYAARRGESTSPSAANTYYWNAIDGDMTGGVAMQPADLTYPLQMKVWMAWDEDYLYLAAEVRDPDGKSGGSTDDQIWNGDTLQIRVDPDGPNSIVDGGEYDPETNKFPWKSTVLKDATNVGSGEFYAGKVANIGISYSDAKYTGMYDMAPRYDPYEKEFYLDDGTLEKIETTWTGKDMFYERENTHENPFGSGYASVYTKSNRANSTNKREYLTTYEVAIPWSALNGSGIYDYDSTTGEYSYTVDYTPPKAGDEFGASIALINRKSAQQNYNSFLTWGSGVCPGQLASADYVTAGGSNSLLLVEDELGSSTYTCAHEFADANCIAPYVCTKCGYKKGFSAGHSYTSVVNAIPTNLTDGKITSTCSVCNDVVVTTIPATEGRVKSTWDGTLTSGGDWSGSKGYGYLFWEDYKSADGTVNSDPSIPKIDSATGAQKNTLGTYEGETVLDLTDYQPGTYFDSNDTKFRSYAYKYSVRLTGEAFPEDEIGGYYPFIGQHVGGNSANASGTMQYGIHYTIGFYPNEQNSTVGKFKIYKNAFGAGATDLSTLITESEEIDLGTTWHEFVTMYDDDTDTLLMTCDGELMVGLWDAGLDQGNNEIQAIFRRYYIPIMMKDMAYGNITAFFTEEGEPTPPEPTTFTVTCDGEVIGTYSEGDTVTLPDLGFKTGSGRNLSKRFYGWTGTNVTVTRGAYSKNSTNSSKRSYTMTMPAAGVELTSVYVAVGDLSQDGKINSSDLVAMKRVIGGESVSDLAMEAADCNLDGKVNSKDLLALKMAVAGGNTFTK